MEQIHVRARVVGDRHRFQHSPINVYRSCNKLLGDRAIKIWHSGRWLTRPLQICLAMLMRADGSGFTRLECGFYAGKFKRDGFNGTRPPCKPETGRTFERALWKRDRLPGTRKLPTNRFPRGKRPSLLFFSFRPSCRIRFPSFATSR